MSGIIEIDPLQQLKNECNFFKFSLREIKHYQKKYLVPGLGIGLQNIIEWLSLYGIMAYLLLNGDEVSQLAGEVAFQVISCTYIVTFGAGQVTFMLSSSHFGALKKALAENSSGARVHLSNLLKQVNIANIVGGCLVAAAGVTVMIPPVADFLTNVFIDTSALDEETQQQLLLTSQVALFWSGIGMLLDFYRTNLSWSCRAIDKVWFSSFITGLSMGLYATAAGIVGDILFEWGDGWLFATRDLGILFAALGIVSDFYLSTYNEKAKVAELLEESSEDYSVQREERIRASGNRFSHWNRCCPKRPSVPKEEQEVLLADNSSVNRGRCPLFKFA